MAIINCGRTLRPPHPDEGWRARIKRRKRLVARLLDPHSKPQMLEIAAKWRSMAAYEEKYGR